MTMIVFRRHDNQSINFVHIMNWLVSSFRIMTLADAVSCTANTNWDKI